MLFLELNFRLDELKEIEESEQELTIRYRPFGIGKLRLLVNMERSLLGFTDMGFQEKDIDDVKGLLVDTEMYILLMTFIVSGLSRPLILGTNSREAFVLIIMRVRHVKIQIDEIDMRTIFSTLFDPRLYVDHF